VFPKIESFKTYELILEDGSIFSGYSFGFERSISGEVVFNTGMVGYYESLTDPSYRGQILTFTYPLIGNYGVPGDEVQNQMAKHFESDRIHVSALIVSDYSFYHSHWNAKKSLSQWLTEQNVPALFGIDTRALTKRLREKGTMLGKIVFDKDVDFYDPSKTNLVKEVSIDLPIIYKSDGRKKIILVDCGVKYNIIRSLIRRDCCVLRVPYDYDFFQQKFDAVVLSNGPGDPKMCQDTIANVKRCLESNIPTLGICLGNQILALAAGANTYKLKYGHRSQNQPSLEVGTKRCYITSQNHGYAVETETLPKDWTPWFQNVNDGTNEGIRHKTKPCMSVQFHPEHTPGPTDTDFLFDDFLKIVDK